ncbi:MAG: hypothetical protein WBC18_07980 [Ottowia sp.]|uniref:hypothetical protein n=1 Tax=Ottowia sp. TaxID=1898956 RepID=UPI003C792E99
MTTSSEPTPRDSQPALPPVTDAHRRCAFGAMQVHGLSFEAAMQHPTWVRVIECAAARLRTKEWQAQHAPSVALVRRLDPVSGRWITQRVKGPYSPQLTLEGNQ